MNSTGTVNSTGTMNSTTSMTTITPLAEAPHRIALVTIYMVVLVAGSVGLILMISILKTNLRSWITIAFLNLLLAHFIFILTVPFRIHYYVTDKWILSPTFCKVVSVMIHLHMHLVFVIYVVILTIRYLQYFKKMDRIEFYRRLHALASSIGIWSILIIICPIILANYGNKTPRKDKCFNFGMEAKSGAFGLNVVLSVLIILVSCILSCVLGVILHSMIKKYGPDSRHQQEFWAQMKSISIILIIFTCLVPYHLFRLYYLQNAKSSENDNEVFLAITAFTCFDMLLTFAGKGICYACKF
ncbi:hypothetical protein NFI96_003067 [Prochilodus magdalenae]|nr:hypothetical protein NFI96_003067 [Prochilodus magdalenae]